MPRAWTARFGRSVAVHVVDAVEQRLQQAPSESWSQLGRPTARCGPGRRGGRAALWPPSSVCGRRPTPAILAAGFPVRRRPSRTCSLAAPSTWCRTPKTKPRARVSAPGAGWPPAASTAGKTSCPRRQRHHRHPRRRRHLEALAHRPAAGLQRGRRLLHPPRPARRRRVQFADQRAPLRRLHPQRPRAAVGPGRLRQRRPAPGA